MTQSASVLGALPHACAILDSRGTILACNARLNQLAQSSQPLEGAHFFETLRHLQGIRSAQDTFARSIGSAAFHEKLRISQIDGDVEERLDLELHGFDEDGKNFVFAMLSQLESEETLQQQAHGLQQRLSEIRHLKHEISNTLMGLMGNAELLFDQLPEDDNARTKLDRILQGGRKMRDQLEEISSTILGR